MAISENKKRIMISLDKNLIKEIKNIAESNHRTVSKEIEILLEQYISKIK